jgi:YfiR/HmsC-like
MSIKLYHQSPPARRIAKERRLMIKGAVLLLLLMSTGGGPRTEAQALDEYQVKAALLFNFIKFVEWPADAFSDDGAPIVVGVVGNDPFGRALDQAVNGKSIRGRQVITRRLRWDQDLRACHLLFISPSERKRLPQILAGLRGASVLTLSDINQSNQPGGIINFILEADKVRFEINASMAEQARLKISSKLLALAKTVRN